MSYPQNQGPEIVGNTSIGPVIRRPIGISGSLRFTQVPSSLEASREIIEAEGIKNPLPVIQQKASEAIGETQQK